MRRFLAILAVAGAIFSQACSSSSTKTDSSSATTAGATATSAGAGVATTRAATGNASFADVCSGRAASAPPPQGQSIDYAKAAKDLQFALDHAPADIKPDLAILSTPLLQYFQILASANGNVVAAAQNGQFQAVAQRFSQADYQAAASRVQAWFASHCS